MRHTDAGKSYRVPALDSRLNSIQHTVVEDPAFTETQARGLVVLE